MFICGTQSIYMSMTDNEDSIYESLDDNVESTKEQNMFICGDEAIYIPVTECDECGSLLERIRALEDMLQGKSDVQLSMTDTLDDTVTVTVIGSVE